MLVPPKAKHLAALSHHSCHVWSSRKFLEMLPVCLNETLGQQKVKRLANDFALGIPKSPSSLRSRQPHSRHLMAQSPFFECLEQSTEFHRYCTDFTLVVSKTFRLVIGHRIIVFADVG